MNATDVLDAYLDQHCKRVFQSSHRLVRSQAGHCPPDSSKSKHSLERPGPGVARLAGIHTTNISSAGIRATPGKERPRRQRPADCSGSLLATCHPCNVAIPVRSVDKACKGSRPSNSQSADKDPLLNGPSLSLQLPNKLAEVPCGIPSASTSDSTLAVHNSSVSPQQYSTLSINHTKAGRNLTNRVASLLPGMSNKPSQADSFWMIFVLLQ